ncbi:hypothetical protein FHS55_002419 [Angulomicrobium tetraedrale]|uniref:Phage integrase central domain-containing protein n=1 Tax=Ancylobacter tetraedralis TaxID=217068 RepID=A0A839ZAM5_9HYPH|nr:hypothetical protein [Ancylobacter tetraedralis]
MRDKAKQVLREGFDPGANKHAGSFGHSFETPAREWFEGQKAAWEPAHFARVASRFENDRFPEIGSMYIGQIEASDWRC